MKKHAGSLYIILAILLLTFSCRNSINNLDIASDLVTVNGSIATSDSFTLNISTIKMDSIVTSSYSKALVGKYTDNDTKNGYNEFGTITAESYFKIAPPVPNFISETTDGYPPTYDSTVLMLRINSYYGDTLKPYTMDVREITSNYRNDTRSYYLFNNTTPPSVNTTTKLGTITIKPHPKLRDSLCIRLDDVWGDSIYHQLLNNNTAFLDPLKFPGIYKGIALLPGENNSSILGFENRSTDKIAINMSITVYYHNGPSGQNLKTVKLSMSSADLQYNRITIDPASNFPLSTLNKLRNIPVSKTHGEAYVQAGTGYRARIEFPTLKYLQASATKIKILSAFLYVTPKLNSGLLNPLPKTISLFQAVDDNTILSSLGTATLVDHTNSDIIYPYYYTFDVTDFVMKQMLDFSNTIPNVIISLPLDDLGSGAYLPEMDMKNSNLDRLIIQDGHLRETSTRLKIMYFKY